MAEELRLTQRLLTTLEQPTLLPTQLAAMTVQLVAMTAQQQADFVVELVVVCSVVTNRPQKTYSIEKCRLRNQVAFFYANPN